MNQAIVDKLNFEAQENKQILLDVLKTNKISLKFEKVDKTIREMNCTLIPDLLPKIPEHVLESQETIEVKPRKESETAFRVWDLDKEAWRSAKWDSLISFDIRL